MLAQYERQFLEARGVAEKLYCQRCYGAGRADGCRAKVIYAGLTALARIECRCRILEGTHAVA